MGGADEVVLFRAERWHVGQTVYWATFTLAPDSLNLRIAHSSPTNSFWTFLSSSTMTSK